MNRLNRVDQLTSATRHKQMLPLMEIDKGGANKDFTTLKNETQACNLIDLIMMKIMNS